VAGLLLDEMFSPQIADRLCKRGHDVLAVAAQPELVGQPDEQILAQASAQDRCLLTENVRDFEILRSAWARDGKVHAGLLYTSRQRFPRERRMIAKIVTALDERLRDGTLPRAGRVDWLT